MFLEFSEVNMRNLRENAGDVRLDLMSALLYYCIVGYYLLFRL